MADIQVVNRALTVVEFLAETPDAPRGLTEVAAHAGLNQATCANILKTLVARGYVEQAGPRQGYTLGPMVYHLTGKESSWKDVALVAEPLAQELAAALREDVVVSILRHGKKYIICQAEGNNDIQLSKRLRLTDDIYQTATGRLLLAHLDAKGLRDFLSGQGLPGPRWPGCGGEPALLERLAAIRRDGLAVNDDSPQVVYLAAPLAKGGRVVAALGVSVPKYRYVAPHSEVVVGSLKAYAGKIGGAFDGKGLGI